MMQRSGDGAQACLVLRRSTVLSFSEYEYHWHSHEEQDEFFYVVDGKLLIELEGHPTVELQSHGHCSYSDASSAAMNHSYAPINEGCAGQPWMIPTSCQ
jgi:hypothetical protein